MIYSTLNEQSFEARNHADSTVQAGQQIKLTFDLTKAYFFDTDTEKRIRE